MDKWLTAKGSWWTPFFILMTVILTRMGFHTHVDGLEFVVIPCLALILAVLPGIMQNAYTWGYALGGLASMSGWPAEGYLISASLGSGALGLAVFLKCKEIHRTPDVLTSNSMARVDVAHVISRATLLAIPLAGWTALGGWYTNFKYTYEMTVIVTAVYSTLTALISVSYLTDVYSLTDGKFTEYEEDYDHGLY